MSGTRTGDGRGQTSGDGGGGLLRGHGGGLGSNGIRLAGHNAEGVCLGQVLSGRVVDSLDGDTALGVGQGNGREGSEDDGETHFDGLEIMDEV